MTEEDFLKLKDYRDELYTNIVNNNVTSKARLLEIRFHIEKCGKELNTPFKTWVLLTTAQHWEVCRKFWSDWKPKTDQSEIPPLSITCIKLPVRETKRAETQALAKITEPQSPPKKQWEITPNDKRFLKSLRIAVDETQQDTDD